MKTFYGDYLCDFYRERVDAICDLQFFHDSPVTEFVYNKAKRSVCIALKCVYVFVYIEKSIQSDQKDIDWEFLGDKELANQGENGFSCTIGVKLCCARYCDR